MANVPGEVRERATRLEALRLRAPRGWFAVLVPLVPLPLPFEQRAQYGTVLSTLMDRLRGSVERSVFLDLEHLHQNNAVREISRHGARWIPEMGMGVEPGAPPPKLWSFAELSERDVTQPMPPLIRRVCHLEGAEAARVHAVQTMCGTGGLLQVVHRVAMDQVIQAWTHNALLRIEEEALRAYPLYLPLLSGRVVQNVSAEELAEWMGPIDAYVRESMEDRGLLIVARQPPELFLEDTGILLPRDAANRDVIEGGQSKPGDDTMTSPSNGV